MSYQKIHLIQSSIFCLRLIHWYCVNRKSGTSDTVLKGTDDVTRAKCMYVYMDVWRSKDISRSNIQRIVHVSVVILHIRPHSRWISLCSGYYANATQMALKPLSYIKIKSCRTYGLHIKRDAVNDMYAFNSRHDEQVSFVFFHSTISPYRLNRHQRVHLVQPEKLKLQIWLNKRLLNKTQCLALCYISLHDS